MSATPQIIIIYNADSTVRGKLSYAYKKLSSSGSEEPICGGMRFIEAESYDPLLCAIFANYLTSNSLRDNVIIHCPRATANCS